MTPISRAAELHSRPEPLLRLAGVAKAYREGGALRTVLGGIDLQVSAGEIVVLFGRSGSGKTTLLNLISGIDRPDRGQITIAGELLTAMSETQRTLFRRARIGIVHQFFNLLPTLTVFENLLLPLELNGLGDCEARVRHLLEAVGLGDRAASYPDRLSGGEQQRVAAVRALVHDPDLVLADEPTGNLDRETGQRLLTLLERMTRDRGHTLLMASHSEETLAFADRAFRVEVDGLVPLAAGWGRS